MKPLKNIFFFFYFTSLGLSGFGQIIDFPDANFKNALVNINCVDTNGDEEEDSDADINDDGEIDVSEALQVKSLTVSNQEILSLEGIANFINIEKLICYSNELTSLDVTSLINLETLSCSSNDLTSLDVKGLTNLQALYCGFNELTSLDVTGLSNLKSSRDSK